jgi:GGDEF domain-containing protein
MTTLSPFLKGGRKEERSAADRKVEALSRIVSVLLQGISLHAFEFDPAAAEAFHIAIGKLRSQIGLIEDEDSALLMAGAAIRLLEENTAAAEGHLHARHIEAEKIVALLADAFLDAAGASEEAMVRVKEIERDLARARGAEALIAGRLRMAASISAIREAGAAANRVEDTSAGETDGVTGLPDSAHGAAAIAEVWNSREDYFAALFAAERLDAINLRFGFEAGDQVLQALSQHLGQQTGIDDRLFRWRGPCIMALMRRRLPESHVAAEAARMAASRLEHAISIRNRDAIVSISTAWNLFPLAGSRTVQQMIGQLNEFAATRSRYTR